MADKELVIKIPEEIRLALINNIQLSLDQQSVCDSYIKQAIINGIPLPKDHGNLKDVDKFLKSVEKDRIHECYLHDWTADDVLQRLDSWYAPTIIEADKESEEV